MTILTLTTLTTFLASLLMLGIAHASMSLPSLNRRLDHFDHIFLVSLLTLGTAHANMALPPINRSFDHILVRLFTLGIAYEKT